MSRVPGGALALASAVVLVGCGVAEKERRVGENTRTVGTTQSEATRIPGTPTAAVPTTHAYSPLVVHALIHGCEKRGSPPHYCECVTRVTEVHVTQAQAISEALAAQGRETGRPQWLKEAREACER